MDAIQTHTLIIGCGIAGATAALRLSENRNHDITIITRAHEAADSNSGRAQGGIVTRGLDDSPEMLVADILTGRGRPEFPASRPSAGRGRPGARALGAGGAGGRPL